MEISSRIADKVIIIDITGEIDIYNTSTIKELVVNKIEADQKLIIINLDKVNYIDSSGIGTLISCNSTLNKNKGRLVIENIRDSVKKIFQLTKLDTILQVAQNEDEALELFKKN